MDVEDSGMLLFAEEWRNKQALAAHFRKDEAKVLFILQPTVAAILAFLAGRRDARGGRPAFFWAFVRDPKRWQLPLLDAWKDIGKLFLLWNDDHHVVQ